MFKFRFTIFAVAGLFGAAAFTQESDPAKVEDASAGEAKPTVITTAENEGTPKPIIHKRRPIPVATPTAATTPKPKQPGFWKRVFGSKSTPVPSTPTPTARTKSGVAARSAPAPAKKQTTGTGVAEKTSESSGEAAKSKPVATRNTAKSK